MIGHQACKRSRPGGRDKKVEPVAGAAIDKNPDMVQGALHKRPVGERRFREVECHDAAEQAGAPEPSMTRRARASDRSRTARSSELSRPSGSSDTTNALSGAIRQTVLPPALTGLR